MLNILLKLLVLLVLAFGLLYKMLSTMMLMDTELLLSLQLGIMDMKLLTQPTQPNQLLLDLCHLEGGSQGLTFRDLRWETGRSFSSIIYEFILHNSKSGWYGIGTRI